MLIFADVSGAHHMRPGMLVTFQMSLTFKYLDARHICMCLLTNSANWMPRPFRSHLLGMSWVLKVTSSRIKIPTPSTCLEMWHSTRVASHLGTKRQVLPPCLKPLYHSIQCMQCLTHLLCHTHKRHLLPSLKGAKMTLKTYYYPKSSDHKHCPCKDPLSPLPPKRNKSCPLYSHLVKVQYALSDYH